MFESIKNSIQKAIHVLKGNNRITEGNISEVVKEIRRILLRSDVNYNIAKELTDEIKNEAIGTEVVKNLNPGQVFIKIFNDKLVKLMSCGNHSLIFSNKTVILLLGLQGAGKTTFAHKLAKYVKNKHKKKPLLIACDIYRPAAIEQLEVLAKNNAIDFFKKEGEKNVNKIIEEGLSFSEKNGNNVLIIDTAGRQTVDNDMMDELKKISNSFNITESLLVLDGMIGQTSIEIAKSFNEAVNITGVVLTKMDGDANGGVALSVAKSINKPIKLISIGEKIDDLDEFHPDRIANRILGKGDIVTLVEQMENEATNIKNSSIKKDNFNYLTFKEYIKSLENIGGSKRIIDLLPGSIKFNEVDVENRSKAIKKTMYIIDSMTMNEKKCYCKLSLSRKIRIANGSGTTLDDVNATIKIFDRLLTTLTKFKNKSFTQMIESIKNNKF